MAGSLDKAQQIVKPPAGAGGRLGGILDVYGRRQSYMGRRQPIPGDEPRILLHRPEIEAIRAALVTALEIIDQARNR